VALDLEDFAGFSAGLKARGWIQETRREHRWHGPNKSMIDLMPAGPKLRAAKQIIWPETQFPMSLVGFDHVFAGSVRVEFAPNVTFKVAPLPVVAFLKIVAFSEAPYRREKDLDDLKSLFHRYENESGRIFSDEVFAVGLDLEYANAFLLGSDIGAIATDEDAKVVHGFLTKHRLSAQDIAELDREDLRQDEVWRFQMQLAAFAIGFDGSIHPNVRH
jgi:predicted nucleotidyltransferase